MRPRTIAAVATLSLVSGFVSAASLQAAPVTLPSQECEVRVTQPIEVKEGEQEIRATVTTELAAELKAEFPETSNLKATSVQKADEANVIVLKVDASKATPGSFPVALTSGEATCKGEVTVAAVTAPTAPTTPAVR